MSKSFVIEVNCDLSSVMRKAEKIITEKGGNFSGDKYSGWFIGKTPIGAIEGKYQTNNNKVEIIITDKPFVISYNKIESVVREYFR